MAGTGGKRVGAGRKPGSITSLKKISATEILAGIDEYAVWNGFVRSEDENVALKAMIYLTDRRDGKAKQLIEASGPGGGAIPVSLEIDL